jgi:cytochrome P450
MDFPRDALAAPSHPDPYPWYARLAQEAPLAFDERLGLWIAAAPHVVRQALAQPELRVRPLADPVPAALARRPTGEVFALLVRMNDGEFHARHRPDVAAAAGRWNDGEVAAAAAAAALDLAPGLDPNALLSALPVQAMARLLGVPGPELRQTVRWVHDFTAGIAAGADAAALERADAATQALMAQGEAQGLSRVRAANRIALMQQSLDATAGLIGNAASLLLQRPQPSLASIGDAMALVAEAASRDPAIHNTRRFAAAPLELGGQRVAAGQGVVLLLAPARLAFGAGAHACPGERLALGVAAAGLHALASIAPLPRLFGRATGWRPLPNARIPVFAT